MLMMMMRMTLTSDYCACVMLRSNRVVLPQRMPNFRSDSLSERMLTVRRVRMVRVFFFLKSDCQAELCEKTRGGRGARAARSGAFFAYLRLNETQAAAHTSVAVPL